MFRPKGHLKVQKKIGREEDIKNIDGNVITNQILSERFAEFGIPFEEVGFERTNNALRAFQRIFEIMPQLNELDPIFVLKNALGSGDDDSKFDAIRHYLSANANATNERFNRLETRMEENFNAHEQRLVANAERLDSIEQRLDSIEQKLDSIEQKLDIIIQHIAHEDA